MQDAVHSKHWYLKQVRLFSDLSDEEIKSMESMTRMEYVRKGQPIYIPGDEGEDVYFLKKGRVKISRLMGDGHELTLTILEPGEIFGEIEALEDTSRDSLAVAQDDSYLCVMRKKDFESFLKMKPDLHIKLTKLIGLRLKSVENRIEDLLYRDIPARLARLLLKLAEQFGYIDDAGIHIRLQLTHQEIANLIASSRETVSLTLGGFREKGIIEFNRKEILIKDTKALEGFFKRM
ncbi:MAG: Crp/Fnr family transcriptional regulator [Nitrospirae bacterium]|nr:Crp/Fnr family transcriptional regulator [Nitrospirota bacterium]